MICPYCKKEAIWADNSVIYGKIYGKSYKVWWCKPCDAYVGCHNNTKKPLGSMANKALRRARMEAHLAFDALWKSGEITRREAYKKLKERFGKEMHIGESDEQTCFQIINFYKEVL